MFEALIEPQSWAMAAIALPVAAGLVAIELGASVLAGRPVYDAAETAVSVVIAIGQRLIRAVEAGLIAIPFAFVYEHRLFEIDTASPAVLIALFFAVEFAYYWQHRAAHRIRFMWANHAVHHSATRFNLSAAIRLGWTSAVAMGFVFYLPLAWLGFHPGAIVAVLGANLAYQFVLHTELAPRFGPLEWVFNTPTHHAVHHASNGGCLDKNFGGVLIVFDRMFGTFAAPPKGEAMRYGLAGRPPQRNPLRVAFGEWLALAADLRRVRRPIDKLRLLVAAPGWEPADTERASCSNPVGAERSTGEPRVSP